MQNNDLAEVELPSDMSDEEQDEEAQAQQAIRRERGLDINTTAAMLTPTEWNLSRYK
jgi:hypothetical protein